MSTQMPHCAMANFAPQGANSLVAEGDQPNRDSAANLAIRHCIGNTEAEWNSCIARDLESRILDDIYPFLWLVARKSGTHIDSLHKQLVKNRVIIISEEPKLHLVWYYGTIYVKPLPDYLLNHVIWRDYIPKPIVEPVETRPRYDKYRAAVGYLRSYSFLIQHESDFIIAQKLNLLPKYLSFQKFQRFIQPFRSIPDDQVAHRYQYGQFRLTRLNLAVHIIQIFHIIRFFRTKERLPWYYQEQLWQTAQYIQQYAAPLVFVFAILSIILSSMQVVLAALGETTWHAFVRASWGFSVATIIFAASPIVIAFTSIILLLIVQGQFAVRTKIKERQHQKDIERQYG